MTQSKTRRPSPVSAPPIRSTQKKASPLLGPAAIQFFDEALPQWVKQKYAPPSKWQSQPFNEKDVQFFSRGLRDLSESFTSERGSSLPDYFKHPRFRSAYLLYFLPLQAAKFSLILQRYADTIRRRVKPGEKFRIWDVGAGPGTASIALWLAWKDFPEKFGPLPPLEYHWIDTHFGIMKEGEKILKLLDPNAAIQLHELPWQKLGKTPLPKADLILMGNVWNEAPTGKRASSKRHAHPEYDDHSESSAGAIPPEWSLLAEWAKNSSLLFIEPANKLPSQTLSLFRDWVLGETPVRIIGPCLHDGLCPLSMGRDWCHFSTYTGATGTTLPLKWFKAFSRSLGSEREWLKYSYLWLEPKSESQSGVTASTSPAADTGVRLAVSDPIQDRSGGSIILLCEPGQPRRWVPLPGRPTPLRGEVVILSSTAAARIPLVVGPKTRLSTQNGIKVKK